jgi:cyclic beta-1,2-glucan synthetase
LRGIRDQVENLVPWALPLYLPFFSQVAPLEEITLSSLPAVLRQVESEAAELVQKPHTGETERGAARLLYRRLPLRIENSAKLLQALRQAAKDADRLVENMDFRFLYNPRKKMFSTGFNATTGKLDTSHYELLASEARTAVFIAAAKGEVSPEAWLHLGRPLTFGVGERLLLSWSGTMFEYLMPALWMHSLPETIMDQTLRAAVHCQQAYGRKSGVPSGISEAAFSERNPVGIYGYRAFGVPGLAIDPHSPENLVVSPYSSFLALLAEGDAPAHNLEVLREMGCLGPLGYYESCDFTPVRDPENGKFEVIRCWMAHHQGMSLVALCNFLNQSSIQKWFHREPKVKAAELFLHEKVALSVPVRNDFVRSSDRTTNAKSLQRVNSHVVSPANA